MRVLVCPDKFRGSMTASSAARAMTDGLHDSGLTDVQVLPLADGGEGTSEVLSSALAGREIAVSTVDALGNPILTSWLLLSDGTALVEAARSIGLARLETPNDPIRASSAGLGIVIDSALAARPRRLVVTLGGTATTDAGLPCLDEMGWDLMGIPTVVASDVRTLLAEASAVFAPQKGADAAAVVKLTDRLRFAAGILGVRGRDASQVPGSGAAGGIAAGLAAIGAEIRPGFDIVSEAVCLDAALEMADLVVTGEGFVDQSTLAGKVVGSVVSRARDLGGKYVVVIAGDAQGAAAATLQGSGVTLATLVSHADSHEAAMLDAPRITRIAVRNAIRSL